MKCNEIYAETGPGRRVRQLVRGVLTVYCYTLQAMAFVYDKELVANLFTAVPERYGERNGGYTRVKADPVLRRGDATEMAVIELV